MTKLQDDSIVSSLSRKLAWRHFDAMDRRTSPITRLAIGQQLADQFTRGRR